LLRLRATTTKGPVGRVRLFRIAGFDHHQHGRRIALPKNWLILAADGDFLAKRRDPRHRAGSLCSWLSFTD